MEKRTFTFILSLIISFLTLFTSSLYAQRKVVVTKDQPDTIPFYRGIALGTDIVGSAMMFIKDYGQYEGIARLNLKDKYFPVLELGFGKSNKTDETTNIHYSTKAPYFRVGIDLNVLKNKHDDYRALVGGRLAYTSFKYSFYNKTAIDPIWKSQSLCYASNVSSKLLWAELVAGLDAKIWGPIRMGWTIRYKKQLHKKTGENGSAWYVPGYGEGAESLISATFQILAEF